MLDLDSLSSLGLSSRRRAPLGHLFAATLLAVTVQLAAGCDDPAAGPPDLYADDPRPSCGVPSAPVLDRLHGGARIDFTAPSGEALETGTSDDPDAWVPDAWSAAEHWVAPALSDPDVARDVKVFARVSDDSCAPRDVFAFTYRVASGYTPAADQPGSDAIGRKDPAIRSWASEVVDVTWGSDVDAKWRHPEEALGAAEGTTADVVSLGEGGVVTLAFNRPIADGKGPDLAVFENAFSDSFLEFAFVEVSSDGDHFERFDSASLVAEAPDAYGTTEPEEIGGLAGKHRGGWGTPFDLGHLAFRPAAQDGRLDVDAVRYVRVVDIIGDGREHDSFGAPIYDPTPTVETAGFDLDAVAVLHEAP